MAAIPATAGGAAAAAGAAAPAPAAGAASPASPVKKEKKGGFLQDFLLGGIAGERVPPAARGFVGERRHVDSTVCDASQTAGAVLRS